MSNSEEEFRPRVDWQAWEVDDDGSFSFFHAKPELENSKLFIEHWLIGALLLAACAAGAAGWFRFLG